MLSRLRVVRRQGLVVRWAGGLGAVIPLIALVFVLATLIIEALPAIRLNGLHFFTATEWNPGNLYGNTVVTDGVPHPTGAYYGASAADRRHPGELCDRPDRRGAGVHRSGVGDRGTVAETSRLGGRHGTRIARRHPQCRRRPLGGNDIRAVHRPPHRSGDRPQRSRCAGARLLPRRYRQRRRPVGVRSGAGGDDHSHHRQHHP